MAVPASASAPRVPSMALPPWRHRGAQGGSKNEPSRRAIRLCITAVDHVDSSWTLPRHSLDTPSTLPRHSHHTQPLVRSALCADCRYLASSPPLALTSAHGPSPLDYTRLLSERHRTLWPGLSASSALQYLIDTLFSPIWPGPYCSTHMH